MFSLLRAAEFTKERLATLLEGGGGISGNYFPGVFFSTTGRNIRRDVSLRRGHTSLSGMDQRGMGNTGRICRKELIVKSPGWILFSINEREREKEKEIRHRATQRGGRGNLERIPGDRDRRNSTAGFFLLSLARRVLSFD